MDTSPVLGLILRRKAGQPAVLGTTQPLVLKGPLPTIPQISAWRAAKRFRNGTGTRGTGCAATGGAAIRLREARKAAKGAKPANTSLGLDGGVEAFLGGLRVIGGVGGGGGGVPQRPSGSPLLVGEGFVLIKPLPHRPPHLLGR